MNLPSNDPQKRLGGVLPLNEKQGPSTAGRQSCCVSPYETPTDRNPLPAAGARPFLLTFCGRLDKK